MLELDVRYKIMKNALLTLLLLGVGTLHGEDIAFLSFGKENKTKLGEVQMDVLRANLIHIFDTAMFHQLEGGQLPAKEEEKIREELSRVESGTHIEIILVEPAKIIVESRTLHIKRMWVSIRESDGLVYDWIFETPNGKLIELEKARGELMVRLAPFILELLKQTGASQAEVATP